VILAGQESLSLEIIDKLEAFVETGGALVFTGNTAAFNQWRERRRSNPLIRLLGESIDGKKVRMESMGLGKLVYIPEIKIDDSRLGSSSFPGRAGAFGASGRPFPSKQWLLPVNHEEVVGAISAGLSKGFSVETEAPLTTVMEVLTRLESRETILHFVNFEQVRRLEPFEVTLKKQFDGGIRSVRLFVPELDDPLEIPFTQEGGIVAFTVPGMNLYAMLVVGQ
jgi:hypothetical protein